MCACILLFLTYLQSTCTLIFTWLQVSHAHFQVTERHTKADEILKLFSLYTTVLSSLLKPRGLASEHPFPSFPHTFPSVNLGAFRAIMLDLAHIPLWAVSSFRRRFPLFHPFPIQLPIRPLKVLLPSFMTFSTLPLLSTSFLLTTFQIVWLFARVLLRELYPLQLPELDSFWLSSTEKFSRSANQACSNLHISLHWAYITTYCKSFFSMP